MHESKRQRHDDARDVLNLALVSSLAHRRARSGSLLLKTAMAAQTS